MIVAPSGLSGPSSDASWTNTGFIQAKMQALAHTVSPKASLAFYYSDSPSVGVDPLFLCAACRSFCVQLKGREEALRQPRWNLSAGETHTCFQGALRILVQCLAYSVLCACQYSDCVKDGFAHLLDWHGLTVQSSLRARRCKVKAGPTDNSSPMLSRSSSGLWAAARL